MTRQKKEIIRRIDYLNLMMEADMELGCGFAPAGAYESTEREIDNLYETLAHLRHYPDGMAMMMDERGMVPYYADPEIPFR